MARRVNLTGKSSGLVLSIEFHPQIKIKAKFLIFVRVERIGAAFPRAFSSCKDPDARSAALKHPLPALLRRLKSSTRKQTNFHLFRCSNVS
jgi:hypothetical protein